ncbi:MAG: aminodeoxychorismate/anthranilate synthase component II [Deltaproteobacteria bacterium]|nr:aminodeoxychorismate/anthranilate synthase component II [Deltaproteobacteria bacterium]
MSGSAEWRPPSGPEPAARVVVIDNYDSFTYNLVQALELAGARCEVFLNDRVGLGELLGAGADGFLISAGPCTPTEAGISVALVRALAAMPAPAPVLGICLGHQVIAYAAGAAVERARTLVHGKAARIRHDGRGLFAGLPNPLGAARYNSLVVRSSGLPSCLDPCAWNDEGEIMALRHRGRPFAGVQFHPESVLSAACAGLLENWLASLSPRRLPEARD